MNFESFFTEMFFSKGRSYYSVLMKSQSYCPFWLIAGTIMGVKRFILPQGRRTGYGRCGAHRTRFLQVNGYRYIKYLELKIFKKELFKSVSIQVNFGEK